MRKTQLRPGRTEAAKQKEWLEDTFVPSVCILRVHSLFIYEYFAGVLVSISLGIMAWPVSLLLGVILATTGICVANPLTSYLSPLSHLITLPELLSWPEPLPDAHNNYTSAHAHPSRYAYLLNGYGDGLEGAVFDDAVELLFSTFGETLEESRRFDRSHDYNTHGGYEAPGDFGSKGGYGSGGYGTGGYGQNNVYQKDKTCVEIYGLAHSSTFCLNVFAALSVVGVALLLQFLFFFALEVFCPDLHRKGDNDGLDDILGGLGGLLGLLSAGNASSLFSIDNSNTVTVDAVGGDMMKTGQGNSGMNMTMGGNSGEKNGDRSGGVLEGCGKFILISNLGIEEDPSRGSRDAGNPPLGEAVIVSVRNTGSSGSDGTRSAGSSSTSTSTTTPSTTTTSTTTTTTTTSTTTTTTPTTTTSTTTTGPTGSTRPTGPTRPPGPPEMPPNNSFPSLPTVDNLVLVYRAGNVCFVAVKELGKHEQTGGGNPNEPPTRRRRHVAILSSLLEAKNWLVEEARLFGQSFGGKNSGLCRVLGKFVH